MDTRIITNVDLNRGAIRTAAAMVLVKVARQIAKPLYSFWHLRSTSSWLSHASARLAALGLEAEAVVRRQCAPVPATVRLAGAPQALPRRRS
jgi:hypothetical protein